MLLVDNLAVIGVGQRVFAELAFYLGGQLGNQLVMHAAFDQNVVGCNARLAAVEEFSEHDALRCQLDVSAGIHNAGAFSAQLKHGGR